MNRIDLAGRRAVITGGAQGIGRAIAERFLESGASVSVWDRNQAATDSTVQELSGHGLIHGLLVDVTDAQRIGEAAAETANTPTRISGVAAAPSPPQTRNKMRGGWCGGGRAGRERTASPLNASPHK